MAPEQWPTFTAAEAPFREKDPCVFCGGEDGFLSAHGANAVLIGMSMRELRGAADEPLGESHYAALVEGEVQFVEYAWPRPSEEEPTAKSSYVTKVDDQICDVGYYQK